MTNPLDHPVLHKAIASLEVSEEFKRMARANHFNTLAEMLTEPFDTLPQRKLSGYRILRELLAFLEKNGLGELIKD